MENINRRGKHDIIHIQRFNIYKNIGKVLRKLSRIRGNCGEKPKNAKIALEQIFLKELCLLWK